MTVVLLREAGSLGFNIVGGRPSAVGCKLELVFVSPLSLVAPHWLAGCHVVGGKNESLLPCVRFDVPHRSTFIVFTIGLVLWI